MTDFLILKKFNVNIHPPNAPRILEIIWQPPALHWIKCNTDGSTNAITSSSGGIFRDKNVDFKLCFSENLGVGNDFFAELCGAMRAIELAKQYNWKNLWLESDSILVIQAFNNKNLVPLQLKNRWENCIFLLSSMHFMVTHVYRADNQCADLLANFGLFSHDLTVWFSMPDCIREFFLLRTS